MSRSIARSIVYREPVLDMQLIQERIAGAAMELFASTCALSRWDSELQARGRNGGARPSDFSAPDIFPAQIDSARQEIVGGGER